MSKPEFHINQIIDLVRAQEPSRLDIIAALEKVERKSWIRQAYIHFVSAERANKPGSEWQFDENLVLEHDTEGTIVLDLLKDGRIGGIEFLSQIKH